MKCCDVFRIFSLNFSYSYNSVFLCYFRYIVANFIGYLAQSKHGTLGYFSDDFTVES